MRLALSFLFSPDTQTPKPMALLCLARLSNRFGGLPLALPSLRERTTVAVKSRHRPKILAGADLQRPPKRRRNVAPAAHMPRALDLRIGRRPKYEPVYILGFHIYAVKDDGPATMIEKLSRSPQQERSRLTTKRFVKAAMKLLEKQTFADLSVIELAQTADRSVGTFYQRFGSKEEFLKTLITDFLETGVGEEAAARWEARSPEQIFSNFLGDSYIRILKNRNLWHAALELSSSDPNFWGEYGGLRAKRLEQLIEAIEKSRKRKLTQAELRRFAIATQIFNSVINNQIINSPGPLSLGDDEFLPTMTKIVLDVAGITK